MSRIWMESTILQIVNSKYLIVVCRSVLSKSADTRMYVYQHEAAGTSTGQDDGRSKSKDSTRIIIYHQISFRNVYCLIPYSISCKRREWYDEKCEKRQRQHNMQARRIFKTKLEWAKNRLTWKDLPYYGSETDAMDHLVNCQVRIFDCGLSFSLSKSAETLVV